jgi:hypothetical protein
VTGGVGCQGAPLNLGFQWNLLGKCFRGVSAGPIFRQLRNIQPSSARRQRSLRRHRGTRPSASSMIWKRRWSSSRRLRRG